MFRTILFTDFSKAGCHFVGRILKPAEKIISSSAHLHSTESPVAPRGEGEVVA